MAGQRTIIDSGLVLVARTRKAMVALTEAFTARTVKKTYLALIRGRPLQDEFNCDAKIGKIYEGTSFMQLNTIAKILLDK